jgi:ligand-binding sensor domain-containing protein
MRHDIRHILRIDVFRHTAPLVVSLVVFLGGVAPCAAQTEFAPERAFRAFTRGSGSTGLPGSTVAALHTDREGTVWISTFEGVARVQRGDVERLTAKNAPVSGNAFRFADRRSGGIFVSTAAGVYACDGTSWTLYPTPVELTSLAEDTEARLIGLDRRGHLWTRSSDGEWLDVAGAELLSLRALATDPKGNVIAAAGRTVIRIEHGMPGVVIGTSAPEPLTTVLAAADGRLWAGSETGRLYSSAAGEPWRTHDIPAWRGGRTRALTEDRRHRIWAGGDNGNVAVGTANGSFTLWTPANGLRDATVTAITGDFTGAVWLGYNGAGLQQWLGDNWHHRTFFREPGDADATITFGVKPTADGGFLAAEFSRGVSRWNGRAMQVFGRAEGLTEDVRVAVEPAPGEIWAATRAGIFELRGGRFVRTLQTSMFVSGFFRSPSGEWYATTTADGIFVQRGGAWVAADALNTRLKSFTPSVRELLWRANGQLWVATSRQLLSMSADGTEPAVPVTLPDTLGSVNTMLERNGEVWVGGVGGIGVRTGDAWRMIHEADGLPGSTVYAMAVADDGSLWVGGSQGVGHLDDAGWTVFDASNGLISEECNSFGVLPRPNGQVLVGTMSGLALFDPRELTPLTRPPLKVYWRGTTGANAIRLPADDRRLTLEWSAPWPRPVTVLFRTRIPELDAAWSEPQTSPTLRVENLAAGRYTVEVQARFDRASAEWTAPLVAHVVVEPRVWETLWAKLAVIALAALAVAGLVRWRTARLAARAQQLERAVAEAMSSAKVLRGLLPICAHCKKVRDDGGYWTRIEDYISRHSEADFSHGFCPDCLDRHYADPRTGELD